MIVIVGIPCLGSAPDGPIAEGLPSRIARAAAASGADVQLIGKVGDDPAGDAILADLARAGVGHAALLRDPGHPTRVITGEQPTTSGDGHDEAAHDLLEAAAMLEEEPPIAEPPAQPIPIPGPSLEPADLELGLRYLVSFAVVVAADPLDHEAATVIGEAAAYAGAQVVALTTSGSNVPEPLAGATVLEVPPDDPDGAFARLVAAYAVALDNGAEPADAFRTATEAGGWEATPA